MNNFLTFNPTCTIRPTNPRIATLCEFKNTEDLKIIHDCLVSHIQTRTQLKELYGKTFNISQLDRGFPIKVFGSFDDLKQSYKILYLDDLQHTPLNGQRLSLILRCEKVFNLLLKTQLEVHKANINQLITSLAKIFQEYPIEQKRDFFNHILKPLYQDNVHLSMLARRCFGNSNPCNLHIEFFNSLSKKKLAEYLIYFLLPSIHSVETMESVIKLVDNHSPPFKSFPDMKVKLRLALCKNFNTLSRNQFLKFVIGTYEIIIKSQIASLDEDPEPKLPKGICISRQFAQLVKDYDSDLCAEFLALIATPLFKSSWRIRKATTLLLEKLGIGNFPSNTVSPDSCRSLFQQVVKNFANKDVIRSSFIDLLAILIGDVKTRTPVQYKRKITPPQKPKPRKRSKNHFLNNKQKVGRTLVFEGRMFLSIENATTKYLHCSRTCFRNYYPVAEFPWPKKPIKVRPITEEYKLICLNTIRQAMNYFGIENERTPEDVFDSLKFL